MATAPIIRGLGIMATTVPGDVNFRYIYKINYNPNTDVFRIADADNSTGGIQPVVRPSNDSDGVNVIDDINNGSPADPDDSQLLGDRANDKFNVADSNGFDGTYTFISSVETSDGVKGFVAKKGPGEYFFFADDAYTGGVSAADRTLTLLEDSDQAICFMPGTRIATPAGWTNIEDVCIGHMVLTSDGVAAPVRWVGRQTISARFANETRLPVRIRAGALAENLPSRDLLVSHDHALLVGGVLIQAGALINGSSIVRETQVPDVFTYYHIELADHSLILAEGVSAETFVDNVDRQAFDNWSEYEQLYPGGNAVPELSLPRVKAQRQVPAAIWNGLLARCGIKGLAEAA
jgi:hypothetical protein